jgi:hypothetical protein
MPSKKSCPVSADDYDDRDGSEVREEEEASSSAEHAQ